MMMPKTAIIKSKKVKLIASIVIIVYLCIMLLFTMAYIVNKIPYNEIAFTITECKVEDFTQDDIDIGSTMGYELPKEITENMDRYRGKNWWNEQAQNFRDSGYTDTNNEYWNWTITKMKSKPSNVMLTMTREDHYFRNDLNIEFSYDDLMKLNERLPENMKWSDKVLSDEHQNHIVNGRPNIKFVSGCGHFEVIYNDNHEIQNKYNNPDDMGTYNYYSPIDEQFGHLQYDWIPYKQYGNVPNSDEVVYIF